MTEKFKQECKNFAYKNRLGMIDYNDGTIAYNDYLKEFETSDNCYVNGEILGVTSAKSITINTLNNYHLEDGIILPKVGVRYDNNEEEYIDLGKYVITKPENSETYNEGQYKGYDDLRLLNEQYVCGITEWENVTIADIYLDLCNQMELTPKTLEFINSDLPITGNHYTNNEARRKVMSDIASASCSFVDIDWVTNEIDLVWFDEEITETFAKSDYSSLVKNQMYGPVNCVVIKDSAFEGENAVLQDDESIEEHGEKQIAINGNYLLYTEELRRLAIPKIWDRLKGFSYVACELTSYTGKPYLKRGNKISVQDDEGNYFETYVLNHNFKYDGTFSSIVKSPALTSEETKIKNFANINDISRRTEAIVDKALGEIRLTVSETVNNIWEINQQINGEDGLNSQFNNLSESIIILKETMLRQTSELFEMLFVQTGIQDAVNAVESALNDANYQLNTITEYIRFQGARIELGRSDSEAKLVIQNDRISFMNGSNESAYITGNQLYITDSTILNKLQIKNWTVQEDLYRNLNFRWSGGVI